MAILKYSPLDQQGLNFARPSTEVHWTKLDNVYFKDGRLVPRPGLQAWAQAIVADLPAVEPRPAVALAAIHNPGSSATGRSPFTWTINSLRPDGVTNEVAGWDGDETDVDETGFPDGNITSSSTEGALARFSFGNPTGTIDCVLGYVIHGLAYNSIAGGQSDLKITQYIGSTHYDIGTANIYANADANSEGANWDYFTFTVLTDLSDGTTLTSTDLNNLVIGVESDALTGGVVEQVYMAGDGNYTGFTDPADSGTSAYTDINDMWVYEPGDFPLAHSPRSTAADERQSWTLETSFDATFNTVTEVDIYVWLACNRTEQEVELFFRTGGTDYTLDTYTFGTFQQGTLTLQQLSTTSTTNPATSAAWTQAQLQGGEFGIKNGAGGTFLIRSVNTYVVGTTTGQQVNLEKLWVEPLTVDDVDPDTQVVTTNAAHLTCDDTNIPNPTIADVTNSAPANDTPSIIPLDNTILYGQLYVVNGSDNTMRYPNGSDVFEYLSTNNADGSTAITGKTVEAFADRILYGWVNDNGTITPERVAYSAEFNGGNHLVASGGGDFDIIDSPGGIVKLKTLNEGLCFCGKETGVYALRRTGNGRFPIIVDPIDYETRCIAPMSVQRVVMAGKPQILFFGWNPSVGYNVFSFDGSTVQPVGDMISPSLRDDLNHTMLPTIFAGVEPDGGAYVMFVPLSGALDRVTAYAMSLRSGAWTKWTYPVPLYSAGVWNASTLSCGLSKKQTMVLGGQSSIPYESTTNTYDILLEKESTTDDTPGAQGSQQGLRIQSFTPRLETGDISIEMPEGDQHVVGYRIHLSYLDRGPFYVSVDVSDDGGTNWQSSNEYTLGTAAQDGTLLHSTLDVEPVNGRTVRFRITLTDTAQVDDVATFGYKFEIVDLDFSVQYSGSDGP